LNTREGLFPFEKIIKRAWDFKSKIFIPAAASLLISREKSERKGNAGLPEAIYDGDYVPFAGKKIFSGMLFLWAHECLPVIPDFIAKCGMTRKFAYLMKDAA
jgi:hypothetical protein